MTQRVFAWSAHHLFMVNTSLLNRREKRRALLPKVATTAIFTLAMSFGSVLVTATSANAAVIFVFEGTSSSGLPAGETNYLYDLDFQTTIDSTSGLPNDEFFAGTSYGTLYDIPGFVGASLAAGLPFMLTTQSFGITPAGTAPSDTSLTNITLSYTGDPITVSTDFLFALTVDSTGTVTNSKGQYTGQDTKNAGSSAGSFAANIGFVAVPSFAPVPEPASWFSFVCGGILLLTWSRCSLSSSKR